MAVNSDFARFEGENEKRDAFEATAQRMGISGVAAEKDFWVCRTIDALFNGVDETKCPKMFFKGGTSLSKGYGLIKRSSEDIDIVFSRPGLNASHDPMTQDLSSSAVKEAREDILKRTKELVHGPLLQQLKPLLATCTVEPLDASSTSIGVTYKSVYPADEYLKPYVEIQCGARSDPEPVEVIPIEAYVQADLPEGWNLRAPNVSVIKAERTFLEKLFAIHSEAIRFEDKNTLADRNRLSRHHYDIAMLHDQGVGARALADEALLQSVTSNQRLMWAKPLAVMDSAKAGSFKILPPDAMRTPLRRDYEEMQRMMFGKPEPPDFDWIMGELGKLDSAVNKPPPSDRKD